MRVPQVSERIKEAPAQALRGVFAGIGQLLLITDKLRNKTHAGQDVPPARAPEPSETATDAAAGQPDEAVVPAPAGTAATETVTEAGTEAAEAAANGAGTAAEATAELVAEAPTSAESPGEEQPAPAKAAAPKPARATRARAQAPKAPKVPAPPKPQKARDLDKTGNVRLLDEQAPAAAAEVLAAEVLAAEVPAAEVPAAEVSGAALPLANYDELSVASLRARLRNLDVAQVRQLAEYERAHAARADVITMFERRIAKLEAEA